MKVSSGVLAFGSGKTMNLITQKKNIWHALAMERWRFLAQVTKHEITGNGVALQKPVE